MNTPQQGLAWIKKKRISTGAQVNKGTPHTHTKVTDH